MGNSLESFDGCCMFIDEKKKYGELGSTHSRKIISSNPYTDSPESRQLEQVENLGDGPQLEPFSGLPPYSTQTAAAYHRDSKNAIVYKSYVPYGRDNEKDLPYGYVKDFRYERGTVYGHYPSQPYSSGSAYPEPDQLTETPRMSVNTIRFKP